MNLITPLTSLQRRLQKKRDLLLEQFDLDSYLDGAWPAVSPAPFPHMIIDNVFTAEAYAALSAHFAEVLARGFSSEMDQDRFHPFLDLVGKYEYDGYVKGGSYADSPALSPFYSLAWNARFSEAFNQPTSQTTSLSLHFHPPGDRTGFVHSDFATRSFHPNDLTPNGVIFRERPASDAPPLFKERRIISLIFYLGNDAWAPGDGGETGLYASEDGAPLVLVEPKANRLVAFQISPRSFHAFQQNRTPRSSIVQWFHIDEAWAKKAYPSAKGVTQEERLNA